MNIIDFHPFDLLSVLIPVLALVLWDWLSVKYDAITFITCRKSCAVRYVIYFGLLTLLILLRATEKTDFVYFQF